MINNRELQSYAIKVTPGAECYVAGCLEELQIHPIVPRVVLQWWTRGRWRPVIKELLPGYVLMDASLNEDTYYKVLNIKYVQQWLGMGGNGALPTPIPDDEVAVWRILNNHGDPLGRSLLRRVNNDKQFKVVDGPLTWLEDYIIALQPRQRQAHVRINMYGQTHKLTLGVIIDNEPECGED